jgi:hypothetical protein
VSEQCGRSAQLTARARPAQLTTRPASRPCSDASAVMLFLIFAEILRNESLEFTFLDFVQEFCYLGLGALIWGLAIGLLTYHLRIIIIRPLN